MRDLHILAEAARSVCVSAHGGVGFALLKFACTAGQGGDGRLRAAAACMLHTAVACCSCVLQLRAVGSSAAFCAPITCLLEKTASSCVMSSHSVVRNIVRTIAKNIHA
jgi:hypothetical protein